MWFSDDLGSGGGGGSRSILIDTNTGGYRDTYIHTENIIATRRNVFRFNCQYLTQT